MAKLLFYFFGLVYHNGSTEGLSITPHTLVVQVYFLLTMITWALGNPQNVSSPPLECP